jgi:hypothetical protein
LSHQTKPALGRVPRAALAIAVCLGAALATVPAAGQTIEELSAKNQQLERMLMDLMQEVQTLKGQVEQASTDSAAAKAAAETAAAAVPTPETTISSGNDRVSLTISGQVSRGVLYANDGQDSEIFHVDNANASTRIRFVGEGRFDEDLSIGTNIETQMQSNSTSAVNQLGDRGADGTDFLSQHKLELYFDHQRFGKLTIGQGNTASNGTAEVDLSGTSLVNDSSVGDSAGGLLFRRTDLPVGVTGISPSSPTVGAAFTNLDGLSRDDRVRYDTPAYYGFGLSGSAIADGRWDVAGRFGREFADMLLLEAAMAYANTADAANTVDGSVSALHTPTGLNLTYAAGVSTALTTAAPARNDSITGTPSSAGNGRSSRSANPILPLTIRKAPTRARTGTSPRPMARPWCKRSIRFATEFYVGYHG